MSNIQNTLLDHGAVHKTMPLLQHSDSNLVREYFAFASALLYGLNSRAQVSKMHIVSIVIQAPVRVGNQFTYKVIQITVMVGDQFTYKSYRLL